jgi:hypothetical protein
MAYRLLREFRQAFTRLDTPPFSIRHHPGSAIARRFHEKALSAATHAQLVPADELNKLSTRDHVSRGGSITPYGDSHDIMTETKAALHQSVSERAYFLWEQANQPDGRADDFWHQAREEHFRDRAHRLWEYEGRPEGQADRHWQWTCDYEDK